MSGLPDWIAEVSGRGWRWYAKYLSGNDTLANGSHQAGPYLPKEVIFSLLPSLRGATTLNPRVSFPVRIASAAADERAVTAIWYNNATIGDGTRNEARITNWGGGSSPILDPEATGALCIMAFYQDPERDTSFCSVWICQTPDEEDLFAETSQKMPEPGGWLFMEADGSGRQMVREPRVVSCALSPDEMPANWRRTFPDAADLIAWTVAKLPLRDRSPDYRLLRRRACEFEAFRSIEELTVLPRVREGFSSVDAFVSYAGAVTNRRKSRSGRSLELHLRQLFDEESVAYSHGAISEGHKRPDFLFPSAEAYQSGAFPAEHLRMLAVKTTCKDRWRQVLNEADRIETKHLLTLQEGVSIHQFEEMRAARVRLVVPSGTIKSYPASIRSELLALERFIGETTQIRVL